jgi:hypothetical protein
MNPVHIPPFYFSKIHFIIILPPTSRSSYCFFPSRFPTKNLLCFSILSYACYKQPIFLDFVIVIIRGEECKLRSSSLCSFLQPSVT